MEYKINQNGSTLLESVYNNRNLTDEYIDSLLYSETWEDPINYKNINEGYELLMNTIKRGYAIVKMDDKVLSDIKKVKNDDMLNINLKDGMINAKVLEVKYGKEWK